VSGDMQCGEFRFCDKTLVCVLPHGHEGPHKAWTLVSYRIGPPPPIVIDDDESADDEAGEVVTDRLQGVDCWLCEESRPHTHAPGPPRRRA
jgi:hypothetical protein